MEITITTNGGKIYAEPNERMSAELFKLFRRNGWLWSGRESAFCFNDNENGAARVRALFSGAYYHNAYGISDATKEEAAAVTFEYADEETRAHFEEANDKAKAEQEAAQAEKERRTAQANAHKIEQIKKILDATRDLPNGWQPALTYGFACPILTTAEFFERGGLVFAESVKVLAEQYGIDADAWDIDERDYLQLKINYNFKERRYNYFNGNIDPERREMRLTIQYWRKSEDGKTYSSMSGNFDISATLTEGLKQRTLAGYRKYAEMCGDDVKRAAVVLYLSYCAHNKGKAASADVFTQLKGNGTATLEQILTACAV